jgi:hypothetical protein
MAFVYTLTNAAVTGTDPAGTDLISLGDDNIRGFKSAMVERVNSRFVDVNADPWIIKSPAGGSGNTQSLIPTADNVYVCGEAARRWASVQAISLTGAVQVTGGAFAQGTIFVAASSGLTLGAKTGSSYDFALINPANTINVIRVPTGTSNVEFAGTVISAGFTGNLTGTILTAAQGNITSVGTLTSLQVLQPGGFVVGSASTYGLRLFSDDLTLGSNGTTSVFIQTFASRVLWLNNQGNLVHIGASGLTVDGTITGNVTGNLTGTILTAAQGNITSLGTLTSLIVSGSFNMQADSAISTTKKFYLDGGGDTYLIESSANTVELYVGGTSMFFANANGAGLSTPVKKLFVDGGGDTYIIEDIANRILFVTGGSSTTGFNSSGVTSTTFTGNLTGNVTGTILTAAQANITSLGALTGLVLNGALNQSNIVGTAQHIGGTTGTSLRNNANSVDNLLIADNGDTTVRGLLLVSSGNLQGMTKSGLGNGLGAQITLAKVSTVGAPVANAAQQAWLKMIGSDGITYQVPGFN